jgi:hypothetical protein
MGLVFIAEIALILISVSCVIFHAKRLIQVTPGRFYILIHEMKKNALNRKALSEATSPKIS